MLDDPLGGELTAVPRSLEQFLELLRIKNVLPHMVSQHEAETAFYESVRRRGMSQMAFDDFKGCIREILASKDMLTQSGTFQMTDVRDSRSVSHSDVDDRPGPPSMQQRGSEQQAYDEYLQWQQKLNASYPPSETSSAYASQR